MILASDEVKEAMGKTQMFSNELVDKFVLPLVAKKLVNANEFSANILSASKQSYPYHADNGVEWLQMYLTDFTDRKFKSFDTCLGWITTKNLTGNLRFYWIEKDLGYSPHNYIISQIVRGTPINQDRMLWPSALVKLASIFGCEKKQVQHAWMVGLTIGLIYSGPNPEKIDELDPSEDIYGWSTHT